MKAADDELDAAKVLRFDIALPGKSQAAAQRATGSHGIVLALGTELLLTSTAQVLACRQYSDPPVPMSTLHRQSAPVITCDEKPAQGICNISLFLFPQSQACQDWVTQRLIPAVNVPWEQALLHRLGELHVKLVVEGELLPGERGLRYHRYAELYDEILPGR